jgi:steroid delta-isomerase-like uncharacterized protein
MEDSEDTLLHEWFEQVWNQGREEAIDRLFSEEGVAHGLSSETGEAVRGPEAFKPFFRQFKSAFPDLRVDVVDTVREGDKIAARCEVRGTHTGDGLGIPPTQKPVSFTGILIARIRDGKIVEAWNNFDFQALDRQLADDSS